MGKIVLNLSDVRDAHAFEKRDEIIQWEAMEVFFEHLRDSLQKASAFPDRRCKTDSCSRLRYHDTITVCGPRGSGKTTFILNLFDIIRRDALNDLFNDRPLEVRDRFRDFSLRDVEVLDILDPTLVEEKEHVFVNILSRIKRKVDVRLGEEQETCLIEPESVTCKSRGSLCSGDKIRVQDGEYRDWIESLRKLAAGLPALNGIGTDELKTEKWHDPVHVMEKGLRNTEASNNLELNFHDFVSRSLRLLDKKVFLLAFDDIDTQFKEGWPVLEVIRKYLTTPQIITVISGDLSLYAMLIRDRQWGNFSDKLLRNERHRLDVFRAMVDQLEDQYLLKILKPERRLGLKTLQEFRERGNTIEVSHEVLKEEKGKKRKTVEAIIEDLCRKIFFVNNEIELYRSHILREPVRVVVQILHAYLDRYCRMELIQQSALTTDSLQVLRQSQNLDNARQDFIHTLIDVFWVPLLDMGFDPSILKNPSARTILNTIVMTLVERGLLFQGYRLKPEHLDRHLNSAMIAVGSMLADLMRRRHFLYFDYFIKVGLPREMSLMLPHKRDNGPSLEDYVRATGIATGEDAVTISRFSAGYSRAVAEFGEGIQGKIPMPVWQGTVALMGLAETGKIGTNVTSKQGNYVANHYNVEKWEQVSASFRKYPREFYNYVKTGDNDRNISSYVNRIDTLFDNIGSWHKYLVTLPVSIVLNKKGERLPVASIFNLIAIIARIIEGASSEGSNIPDAESLKAVEMIIRKHAQLRDYRLPVWEAGSHIPPENQDEENVYEESKEDIVIIDEAFLRAVSMWARARESLSDALPIHILGKMTTRFSYTLSSIKEVDAQDLYLGQLLHRFIVAFLNAVLVEEQLHLPNPKIGSLKNPIGSDHLFFQNLKSVFGEQAFQAGEDSLRSSESPFFCWVASCPLLLPFINPQPTGRKEESLFTFLLNVNNQPSYLGPVNYQGTSINIDTLFPLLNSVLLQKDTSIRKQEDASPPIVDINRKMTNKDIDWLNEQISFEISRRRGTVVNAIKNSDADGFINELTKRFFVTYLKQRSRPLKRKSRLREQVEVFLAEKATHLITSKTT